MSRSLIPIALLLLMAAPPAPASAAKNRLLNGGFETGLEGHPWMPAAWDTSRSGLPTVFFGRDTLLAHGGRYCVSVANASVLLPMAHNWSQRLLVGRGEWGKDLVFSVWTRTTSLEGRAYIMLQAYRDTISWQAAEWGVSREEAMQRLRMKPLDDPLVSLGWNRIVFLEPETDWVRRDVRVYCPAGANVVFVRVGVQGLGQVLLDDAALTVESARPAPEPRPGENLLLDPGFEGNLSDWEIATPALDGLRVERDTTDAHGGGASLVATGGTAMGVTTRIGVCQAIANRALAGKRIRLTGWVRTDSLKSSAYAILYAHTPRGVVVQPQGQQFSRTTPWTKTTLEMDVPPDASLIWAWFCHDGPRAGIVHWDDCSLEVIGKAKTPGRPPLVR